MIGGRASRGKQFLNFLSLEYMLLLHELHSTGEEEPEDGKLAVGVVCPGGSICLRKKNFSVRAASRVWALAIFSST